jgi:hypothetical protein
VSDELTVSQVAVAVDKDPGYVRQHIHRGHLEAAKDDRGRVVVTREEARRWASSRDLDFIERGESTMSGVTHALIMPFPVSNLVTWCGHRVDSRVVKNDFIADSPEAVTCQRCMEVMREAHDNLSKWLPKLSIQQPPYCTECGTRHEPGANKIC